MVPYKTIEINVFRVQFSFLPGTVSSSLSYSITTKKMKFYNY